MIRVNFVTRDYIDGLENYYINALGRIKTEKHSYFVLFVNTPPQVECRCFATVNLLRSQ